MSDAAAVAAVAPAGRFVAHYRVSTDRPQLAAALAVCRARRAALVVAKLDRLARNARFLLHVVEGTGEAGVVFCDLPSVPPGPVGKFLLTQMAAVAELEAGLILQRTRATSAAPRPKPTPSALPSKSPSWASPVPSRRPQRSRRSLFRGMKT